MIFINNKPILTEKDESLQRRSQERRGFAFLKKLKEITIGSGDTVFRANKDGIWLGNAVFADAPFSVSIDGTLTCSDLSVTGGSITIGSNAWHVDSSGNMWWGNYSTFASALDKVSVSGVWSRLRVNRTTLGTGYYYENTANVQNVGLDIEMGSGLSLTNSLPCIRVEMGGTGEIFYGDINSTGRGIYITRSVGSGSADMLRLYSSNSTAGKMIDITRSGSGVITAINIDHTTSSNSVNTGIIMSLASNSSTLCYAFRFNGSEIVSAAVGGTQDKKIRVSIGGTDYFIPCYTA